ncbi:MAG: sigma 54-interacting transcriptional regulator [Desulfomonilaceae bacterium]
MDSLSVSQIKRLLQTFPTELDELTILASNGISDAMKRVMGQLADWIAAINLHDYYADRMEDCDHAPFFCLAGEEGVGKRELVLRIHELVERKGFVELPCDSSEENLRSKLFGHTKDLADALEEPGEGKFLDASEGLLVIYEPQKLPVDCQDFLLKWQKLRPIRKPGGDRQFEYPDPVVILVFRGSPEEIIAAEAVLPGLFTKMLPHIYILPLRERPEDVVLLIEYFLRTKGCEYRGRELSADRDLEEEALFLLVNFDWPGNISALREVVTRLVFSVPLSKHQHQITFPEVLDSLETRYGPNVLDFLTPLFRRNKRSQDRRRIKRDDVWLDELKLLRRLMDLGFHLKDLAKPIDISPSQLSKRFKQAGFDPLPQGRPPKNDPPL